MSQSDRRAAVYFAFQVVVVAILVLAGTAHTACAKQGYLRGPDIHGDRIVFAAEGDLWTALIDGREVRRITSHPGDEVGARFSPDGRWIAFSGDYDGNRDLYVMPTDGGEPRRLTWHPAGDAAIGWTPDGSRIIFSSWRHNPHYNSELFTVPLEGGEPERLPIGRANYLAIDRASGRWAFTRTWGGGTWKRYRGGTAPNIWVGDPDRADFAEVTEFEGLDLFPMWHDGRIYLLSDQGGTANIWSMKPDGSDRRRHTRFDEWDARSPAMGPDGRVVFVVAGDIHLFDPSRDDERRLTIDLPSERILTRKRYPDPSRYLTDFALAPDGDRVAIVTRGEIYSIPVEDGVTLPVTRGSGARESRVSYGPEGKRLLYVTDEDAEEAIVTADAWGRGDIEVVKPSGSNGWHFPPSWSPDGKWVAYADQTQTLYVTALEGGETRDVDHCLQREIREYEWSPDGRWLAYMKLNTVDIGSIFIYDTQEDESHQVTSWTTDDRTPTWDPKGRYLYFLSDRTVDPMIGSFDFETIVVNPTRPYMVLLTSDEENPFAHTEGMPPDDEEGKGEDTDDEAEDADDEDEDAEGDDESDDEDADEDEIEPVEIEFERLANRVIELPVDAGRYRGLGATEDKLFYLSFPLRGLAGRTFGDSDEAPRSSLMAFDLEEQEASTFLSGVGGFDLQAKADKILVSKGRGQLYVISAASPPDDDLSDAKVSLDGVVIELDPQEEWRQMYFEAWRGLRDFYWDEGMHGVDWEAIRDQYASMLPRISTRSELRDLLAEMVGELVTSHTYVWGGDQGRKVTRHATGLLGAILEREGETFRVERIYRGDPADRQRSPLLEPGVDVKEGEYILAVNLRPFPADLPFEASLENMADKEVMLTVNAEPTFEGARQVVVKTLRRETPLIYADWVRRNREYVAEETGGKIGYIHLPDMSGRGMIAFDTWFYPQLDREGMVVDVRWNGGGFVSQLILARLQRHIISWDRNRYGGLSTYPYRLLNGPFVVLVNEHSGSDGDIFPEAVQLAGLAPVIGKRSWGGVIGIRGAKRLVDGGVLTHPESAWWDPRRGWGLEGRGVEPDIEVTNLPQDLNRGVDAQLERAIREIMQLHADDPPQRPDFEQPPDRSRKAYRHEG